MLGRVKAPLAIACLAAALSSPIAGAQEDIDQPFKDCERKTETVTLFGKPEQQLSFDYYACSKESGMAVSFEVKGGNQLVISWAGNPGATYTIAEFWALKGEKPSARIRAIAEPSIEAKEKGRCIVFLDYVTGHYAFTPDAAYLEELLAAEEPFSACGTYGDSNDAVQFWRAIDNAIVGYIGVGQDTPIFDPESFRFTNTKSPGEAG